MLKVTINKDLFNNTLWKRGVIRLSTEGDKAIMIVDDLENNKLRALVLYDAHNPEDVGCIYEDCASEYGLEDYPIIVDDAKLIIGGN